MWAEASAGETGEVDATGLASLASLLADSTRAGVCMALMDGRAWTAGELARSMGVAPSTMSEHLSRLVAGGLLVEHRQGRHRYVALAGPEVAAALEVVTGLTEPPAPARTLRAVRAHDDLRRGPTCYDHLAGRLGVAITSAMTARGLLDDDADLAPTAAGHAWFASELGIDLGAGRAARRDAAHDAGVGAPSRRPIARACLDWTERRPHLAGQACAQLCAVLLERAWVVRIGTGRAVRVTPVGDDALGRLLGSRLALDGAG